VTADAHTEWPSVEGPNKCTLLNFATALNNRVVRTYGALVNQHMFAIKGDDGSAFKHNTFVGPKRTSDIAFAIDRVVRPNVDLMSREILPEKQDIAGFQ
jgi:hypothetical protein